jgi:ribose transport system permease protein
MLNQGTSRQLARLFADYGMLLVLMVLCGLISVATLAEQHPVGAAASNDVAIQIAQRFGRGANVLIVARNIPEDVIFAETLRERLKAADHTVLGAVMGDPPAARGSIETAIESGRRIDVIAANQATAAWTLFHDLADKFPTLADTVVLQPRSYRWPNFLKTSNLLNVTNQIAVIAILAVGMTLVILTGGIDLSVGSLIALSAVVATRLMRDYAGAEQAGSVGMIACCVAGLAVGAAAGGFSGSMVAHFGVPPFIATLSMMLVARGLASIVSNDQSVYQVPDSFVWLGRGADLGLPNAVVLMLVLYVAVHIMLSRMRLGRYVYAVGGNREAARLSGVRVEGVLIFAYAASGVLAGLGGIVLASQLKSGAPTYGVMYELYAIAAVVVGGTSISGGEGRIFNTLIGAFIIAVIQNGMNLIGVQGRRQDIIFGLVILAAVLLEKLKRHGWR